jgi:hypothetical protein
MASHTSTLGLSADSPTGLNSSIILQALTNAVVTSKIDMTGASISITGGVTIGSPTGGNKGAGTLNATAVYDDNVLLTDWVFSSGVSDKPCRTSPVVSVD